MLPADEPVINDDEPLPYIFVGDDAFALTTRMLKPYSRTSRSRYMPPESLDSEVEGLLIPGTWRNEKNKTSFLPLQKVARKPAQDGKIIRDSYAQYFATTGAVSWQNKV
nr:unnamed protein product [Callosobruchus analis]